MKTNVVILTDVHYSGGLLEISSRRGDLSDILLLRAVHRVNRYIKPDLVLCLGDFVDDAGSEGTRKVREIMALIQCPKIVVPGNHDMAVPDFFDIVQENDDFLDINGLRFIPFYDEERPGWNAERSTADIERLESLGKGVDGPVISVQHVPLFQPGTGDCPYNYVNAAEIIEVMKKVDCRLTVSGHYHPGFFSAIQSFGAALAAPCICEEPFRFSQLVIDEKGDVECIEHSLSMPEELGLVDCHVHSAYAFCNENMDFRRAVELSRATKLRGLSFTEHSAHLYYSGEQYGALIPFEAESTDQHGLSLTSRFADFIEDASVFRSDQILIGLEIDCDFQGRSILAGNDIQELDFAMGAIHRLPGYVNNDPLKARDCFKTLIERFTQFPMQALAHPFRIFRRTGLDNPTDLYASTAGLLKCRNIAAELNFHTNEPPEEFFRICLEKGVKIVLGSDSHNLYEVGELRPHLDFLRKLGVSDLDSVLLELI